MISLSPVIRLCRVAVGNGHRDRRAVCVRPGGSVALRLCSAVLSVRCSLSIPELRLTTPRGLVRPWENGKTSAKLQAGLVRRQASDFRCRASGMSSGGRRKRVCAGHDVMGEARRETGLASGRCECGSRALDGEESKQQAQPGRTNQGTGEHTQDETGLRAARVCKSQSPEPPPERPEPERNRGPGKKPDH